MGARDEYLGTPIGFSHVPLCGKQPFNVQREPEFYGGILSTHVKDFHSYSTTWSPLSFKSTILRKPYIILGCKSPSLGPYVITEEQRCNWCLVRRISR